MIVVLYFLVMAASFYYGAVPAFTEQAFWYAVGVALIFIGVFRQWNRS